MILILLMLAKRFQIVHSCHFLFYSSGIALNNLEEQLRTTFGNETLYS